MLRPALTIARYTVLEAVRNRLLWLFVLAAAAALAGAGLLDRLALTESREIQLALLAAGLRLTAVGLTAAFVITSMAREAQDKGAELLLALALPRAAYLLGKLAGFGALALLPALLYGALAALLAPAAQSALWGASLLCELWIVAAFALLCALSFSQAVPALAACAGFYLLARAIGGLQLAAHAPYGGSTPLHGALVHGIDLLASLLPALDGFTRTEWLLYASGTPAALAAIAAQSALYVALLGAAGLFDLYRKNL